MKQKMKIVEPEEVLIELRKHSYKKQRDYLLMALDIMARDKKRDIVDSLAKALDIKVRSDRWKSMALFCLLPHCFTAVF